MHDCYVCVSCCRSCFFGHVDDSVQLSSSAESAVTAYRRSIAALLRFLLRSPGLSERQCGEQEYQLQRREKVYVNPVLTFKIKHWRRKITSLPCVIADLFCLVCVIKKEERTDIFWVYKTYRKWLMLSHNMRGFVLYFEDHISSLPLVCHACSKQLNGPFGLMRCAYAISWENAHPLPLPVGKSSTCRRWSQQTGLAIPRKNSFPIMPFSLLMWSTEIFIQTVCCHRNTTNWRANCWPVAADTCISAAICRKNGVFE